ncbi:MAG TPA: zinc ribbon domain-containing protein [Nakamurella sp.]
MTDIDNNFDGRLVAGTRCVDCGHVRVPARLHCCQRCGSVALIDIRVPLQGVFESWTSVPGSESDPDRFALGLVTLDAGPMLTVRVRLDPLQQPYVGAPVSGRAVRRAGAVEQFWFELAVDELEQRGAA